MVSSTTATVQVVPSNLAPQLRLNRLEVGNRAVETYTGLTIRLEAQAYDEANSPFAEVPLVWTVVDPRVGTVTPEGLFTAGDQPGRYRNAIQVTATQVTSEGIITRSDAVTASVVGELRRPELERVEIFPVYVVARQRQIVAVSAIGYDASGTVVPDTEALWSLSDRSLGRINVLGYLTALGKPGTYKGAISVEMRSRGRTASATADLVIAAPLTGPRLLSVQVLPPQVYLDPDEEFKFTAIALDSAGQRVRDGRFTWKVYNPQVGTIDAQGLLRVGSEPGVYTRVVAVEVSQTVVGTIFTETGYATVIVRRKESPLPLSQVYMAPELQVVVPGSTYLFQAQPVNELGQPARNVTITWQLVNPAVGRLGEFGELLAQGPPGTYRGAIQVTVRQEHETGTIIRLATADVVIVGTLERVELDPALITVGEKKIIRFRARGYDENGIGIPGLSFQWEVTDHRAGTINRLGIFVASATPGEYRDVVRVTAIQRRPRP